MNAELINLLNRAAAAIETPADLTDEDRRALVEDLCVFAENVESGQETEPSNYGRFEDTPRYRADMIDAGRGRLLR